MSRLYEIAVNTDSHIVGMGKTIMVSALIQSNTTCDPLPDTAEPPTNKSRQLRLNKAFRPNRAESKVRTPSATLIVAPTSLLNQWAEELQRSSKPGTMEVTVWHGSNRLDLDPAVRNKDEDDKTIDSCRVHENQQCHQRPRNHLRRKHILLSLSYRT